MKVLRTFAAVAVLVAVASCGGGGDSVSGVSGGTSGGTSGGMSGGTSGGTSSTPVSTNAVTVEDNTFGPRNIQIAVGTTVTWTWASGATTHNITFADAASGDRGAGAVYSRTFNTLGTFTYDCTLHGGMSGSVLVK